MTFEPAETPGVVRISLWVDAVRADAEIIRANLYKIVDVLHVKFWERPQDASRSASVAARTIYVITTGGTIEKEYSEATGSVANLDGKIYAHLQSLRLPDCDVRVIPLLNKDSLDMRDSDRELILGTVSALLPERSPIVITHGTDRMVETGMYLQHRLAKLSVPIVLTGAMVPLGFEGSDALQNLTESLFAARMLKPGIFVVIHGQIFPIYRVRKDYNLGRFVWTETKVM